jgi:lactate dehydrogenase-like 2-hydroxyacid dehydrogenase
VKLRKMVVIGLAPDMLDVEHWRQLDELAGTVVRLDRGDPDIPAMIADADGVIVGFAVPVDRTLIDAAPELRYLGVASTAYDVVDVGYATARNITVTTLPGYTTEPVAQFTIAVLLEQASGLAEGRRQRQAGDFFPLGFPARQFSGSNLGVIGLGAIGGRVADLWRGLGARVAYWSRHRKDESGHVYRTLEDLLSWADFVSINLALTPDTVGILDTARIDAIKPGAVVVSAAPMALIERSALTRRLALEDIRVICNHAGPEDIAELGQYPGFIYPPLVYLTPQSHAAMQELLLSNLRTYLTGEQQPAR